MLYHRTENMLLHLSHWLIDRSYCVKTALARHLVPVFLALPTESLLTLQFVGRYPSPALFFWPILISSLFQPILHFDGWFVEINPPIAEVQLHQPCDHVTNLMRLISSTLCAFFSNIYRDLSDHISSFFWSSNFCYFNPGTSFSNSPVFLL